MRVLAAFVLILAAAVIGMAALGLFAPSSPVVRGTPRPIVSATPTPTSSGPRTILVRLTEQELTTAAQGYMPLTVSGITVSDPKIKLERGRLTLTASGRAFILGGQVVVVATPVVTDGKAIARVESATFAGVALPESTKQDIADTFTRVLAANIPSGVRVTSLTVDSGALVVEAVAA